MTRERTSGAYTGEARAIKVVCWPRMRHPSVRALLTKYGLFAKKSWGQNFLQEERVLQTIADSCGATRNDVVVEIGAGLGHLTRALAQRAGRILAIERDRDLARVLRAELGDCPEVEVVEANAATFDFGAAARRFGRPLLVAGNLPYHLSSRLLVHLLDERAHLRRLVLMFQRELALRICAPPGGREYGALSAIVQLHADVREVLELPRGAFSPPPMVRSMVLRFDLRTAPRADPGDEELYRGVVHTAFARRRKTLRNALLSRFGAPEVDAALRTAGIDPGVRVESLGVIELAALSRALRGAVGGGAAGAPS
jgi:16S rRNA (adenine1518-N6/adenine1519-N6)-dimethyltransferase